jgi:MSHA biogenesis protein MshE
LHTNDAMHTLERLVDMGIEGYLIASVLRAIVAQRLLRRVCVSCKQEDVLEPQQSAWLKTVVSGKYQNEKFYTGNGCAHCNNTGYQGRIGVYEMIEPDDSMLEAIRTNDSQTFSEVVTKNKNYVPLLESGLELAAKGITSLDEVMKFAGEYFQEDVVVADSYNIDDL